MHYWSDTTAAKRRRTKRQALPTGQQQHLAIWVLHRHFPGPGGQQLLVTGFKPFSWHSECTRQTPLLQQLETETWELPQVKVPTV